MVLPDDDVLLLLLPGVAGDVQQRALGLTTFARLLAADAHGTRSPSVALSLDHATRELERDGAERCRAALRALLVAHVSAAARPASFLWVGEPPDDVPASWHALHACGVAAHPPLPDERALHVADRLLVAAERCGFDADELALWKSRRRWLDEGARAVEAEFDEGFCRAAAQRGGFAPAWLAHAVECALEIGAVRRARARLERHAAWIARDPRLAQLEQWTRVALDDPPPLALVWVSRVPSAVVEWRDADASARPFLSGKEPSPGAAFGSPDGPAVAPNVAFDDRHALGASVLLVVCAHDDGSRQNVRHDVAAGLRSRFDAWYAERETAPRDPGAPERGVVATAKRVVLRRAAGDDVRVALGVETCAALVVEPVLDRRGEVAGWLWLEFEHRLVPSRADLERAARHWAPRVLDARDDGVLRVAGRAAIEARPSAAMNARSTDSWSIPAPSASPFAPPDSFEPERVVQGELFAALVDDLEMKTAQRKWWGFALAGERLLCVANGGVADDPTGRSASRAPAREPERARILDRARRARGWVGFDEPAPEISVDADSASGVALALEVGGKVRMVLAIESSRRRDFRPADLERWRASAASRAAEFAAAEFRAWHRRVHGQDVWLDRGVRLARRLDELLTAGQSRAPLAVVGPPGSGKTVLARWLHFERGGERRGPTVLDDAALVGHDGSSVSRGAAAGATTWFVPGADRLSADAQASLLRRLVAARCAGSDGGERVLVTLPAAPAELVERGIWSRELAAEFAPFELLVAPLSARRHEIPGLCASLLARGAEREARMAPTLAADAVASLWRREWRRNVRELEAVAHRLVLAAPGREIDARALAVELGRMGLDAPEKLPSRRAERAWLVQALETTRHANGSANKTRAAAYLGWDPDTLVTKLRTLGIDLDEAN